MHRTTKQQSNTTRAITKQKLQTNPKLKNKAKTQALIFYAVVFLGYGMFRYDIFGFSIFCGILCNNII